jgi:transcription termination factor NusB
MYQPRMRDENIRRLYQLKIQLQKPMTHVLDEILNEYFAHSAHAELNRKKNLKNSKFHS